MSVVACSADSRASSQRLVAPGAPRAVRAMHVEIAFDLAPLLGEQHRQQKARAEQLAERARGGACARSGGTARASRPCCAQQPAPDLDVPVLDLGEPRDRGRFFFASGSASASRR